MLPVSLRLPAALAASLLLCGAVRASSQAVTTASKGADLSVFAGFEGAHPDYAPFNTYGAIFGVDYTRYLRFPVEPSLEFRANLHRNFAVNEESYLLGIRVAYPFHRLRPYADFLVGPGTINFPLNVGYTHDNSTVFSYGGGVDLAVTQNFSAKFDLQAQHWNTGEFTYTPSIAAVGVVYRIPFRPHVRQRDLGR